MSKHIETFYCQRCNCKIGNIDNLIITDIVCPQCGQSAARNNTDVIKIGINKAWCAKCGQTFGILETDPTEEVSCPTCRKNH